MSVELALPPESRAWQPELDPPRRWLPVAARTVMDTVLHSYSQIVLAKSHTAGLAVLAASVLDPFAGLCGLTGLGLTSAAAWVGGLPRHWVTDGLLGANAALVGLGLGAALGPSIALLGLAPIAVIGVIGAFAMLHGVLHKQLLLPALSLPFVLCLWVLGAGLPGGLTFMGSGPTTPLLAPLSGLGALVFHSSPSAGLLVLVGIVAWSRIAALHAMTGLAVAAAVGVLTGMSSPILGFNAALTAVALGGVFYIPGPASLLLAAAGSAVAAWLCIALPVVLEPLGLPVLALPLNLVILGTLTALAQRNRAVGPRIATLGCPTPEETLHTDRTRGRRFARTVSVPMRLPVQGPWMCTQGNDGEHTHRDLWRHGLDFELSDSDGNRHRGSGIHTSDWYAMRQPVVAMAAGTVVHVTSDVADNAIGQINPSRNWGNVVVIQHGPELFSVVAHLAHNSPTVVVGQRVGRGQVVGLCGNSGRSTVPHLHVQLQATARLGDATLPIAFQGIVNASTGREHIDALPRKGEVWRNPAPAEWIAQALSFPVGSRWRLVTTVDGVTRAEDVVSDIDLAGRRSLVSDTARLWFDSDDEGFVAYDVVGPRTSALRTLYLGLARVPADGAPKLEWGDWLDANRVSVNPVTWAISGLAAVFPSTSQRIHYRAEQRAFERVIHGHSEPRQPWRRRVRTEAQFSNTQLIRVSAVIGNRMNTVYVEPVWSSS